MQGKRKMSGGKSAHSFYPAPGIYHLLGNRLPMVRDASLHSLVATGCIFIWQNMLPEITFQRWSNPDSEECSD